LHSAQNGAMNGTQSPSSIDLLAAVNVRLDLLGLPKVQAVEAGQAAADALIAPLLKRQRELCRRLADRLPPVDERIEDVPRRHTSTARRAKVELASRGARSISTSPGSRANCRLPVDADDLQLRTAHELPPRQRRPAQPGATTAAPPPASSTSPRAGCRSPTTRSPSRARRSPPVLRRRAHPARPRPCAALVTSTQDEPGRVLRLAAAAPAVVAGVPGHTRGTPNGDALHRARRRWSPTSTSSSHLRQRRRSLPARRTTPRSTPSWTGHTGLVVLAPHLTTADQEGARPAPRRRRHRAPARDGMCWSDRGRALQRGQGLQGLRPRRARRHRHVIADNYFGYCKKEVKTQISYSANLLATPRRSTPAAPSSSRRLQPRPGVHQYVPRTPPTSPTSPPATRGVRAGQPGGHAPRPRQRRTRPRAGRRPSPCATARSRGRDEAYGASRCVADTTYLAPRLPGRDAKHRAPTACSGPHRHLPTPRTATSRRPSPAAASPRSRSRSGRLRVRSRPTSPTSTPTWTRSRRSSPRLQRPVRRPVVERPVDHRPLLGAERARAAVIKLFTPSRSTPRSTTPSSWRRSRRTSRSSSSSRSSGSTARVGRRLAQPLLGQPRQRPRGNRLRLDGDKIVVNMLRVGFESDGSWRLFACGPTSRPPPRCRPRTTSPRPRWCPTGGPDADRCRARYVENCEQAAVPAARRRHPPRLRQAGREATSPARHVHLQLRAADHGTPARWSRTPGASQQFTEPMAGPDPSRAASGRRRGSPPTSSARRDPRLVNGKPSKNPRYLQVRPTSPNPEATASADDGAAPAPPGLPLASRVRPAPVDIVAAGRRNNPAEPGVPPLCAYNPLHYMELPELFMEFISSMTGKSPSTTGAGSEGAMTKGPFNALPPIYDLNAAFLSFALTGYDGWLSSPGTSARRCASTTTSRCWCRSCSPG
jgi:hypothetical protein